MNTTFTPGGRGGSVDAPQSLSDDEQVKEEAAGHNWKFWLQKGLVEYFYRYDQAYGKLHGISQDEIDMVLLEEAKELGPKAQGADEKDMRRFYEVMDHFQAGSRQTLYFKMAELLNSCAGARRRVSEAISLRLARHSDVIYGSPSCDMAEHLDMSSGKPVKYSIYRFQIRQWEYQNTDWQFALGTFGAMWEPVHAVERGAALGTLCASKRGDDWMDAGTLAQTQSRTPSVCSKLFSSQPSYAKVWGSKVWRWHSGTDRASERVHQAAYRLVKSGRLHNFWVIAEPCIVDVETGWPVVPGI